jgi:hypothetical protein
MENNQKLAHVYLMPYIGDMALAFEAVATKGPIKTSIFGKDKLYHNLL